MHNKRNIATATVLLMFSLLAHAQNKLHDWGFGLGGGLQSYSAILEDKLSNPHEYSIGSNFVFSRYLNNHFDVSIEALRSEIRYPVGTAEPNGYTIYKYNRTQLNAAKFTLKYKLDNGYIFPENMKASPYLKIGGGAAHLAETSEIEYFAPTGGGVDVHLGKHATLFIETQYNHAQTKELSFIQHNIGLKVNVGKANPKRVRATRARARKNSLARIEKHRKEQRIARAEKADKRLKELQARDLANGKVFPSEEQDSDLLLMQTVALTPDDEVKPLVSERVFNIPQTEAELRTKLEPTPPEPKPTVAAIPAPPSREDAPSAETFEVVIEKPVAAATLPEPEIPTAPTAKTMKPSALEKPKPAPTPVSLPTVKPTEKPAAPKPTPTPAATPQAEKPTTEDAATCEINETKLTAFGKNINFDSDQYRIRSRMHGDLAKIAWILKSCEHCSYVIIAYTDSDGDADYNKMLAQKRALAVKEYLVSKGIDGSRLYTAAYGNSLPVAPNSTSTNKAKNRRIEFKLNRTDF
jgi:outer membrane protein OmpA-like peptidoglycan-associated protein